MPKKQDWLDIIERASKPKKGTKIPKGIDIYSLSFVVAPNGRNGNGGMQPWNTGAGADGVVQPSKPVALDRGTNPPSVYHEGENVYPFPGGKKIVPAQTEQEQQGLAMEQKEMGYPGYQTGGTVYDDPNKLLMRLAPNPPNTIGSNSQPTTNVTPAQQTNQTVNRPTNVYDLSPTAQTYQTGQQTAFERTGLRAAGTDPLMENISNRALQNYDTRAAVSDTAMRQGLASSPHLTEGAKRAVTAKQQATYRAGLSGLVGDLSEESMRRMEEANREYYEMGRTGYQDELTKQRFEKTFGEQQYQSDVTQQRWREEFDFELQKYGDQEFARMADDAQNMSFDTWQQKYPTATFEDYTKANEFRDRQLETMDVNIASGWESLAQLKKSDQWADAKRFLDAGDIQGYANYVQQITGRPLNWTQLQNIQNYNDTMMRLGIDAQTIANDAARLGVNAGQLDAFIFAVNNGADKDAANQASGLNLTDDQFFELRRNYTYEGQMQKATITSVNNRVGNEIFDSVMEMINGGASLDRVNQRYPNLKLTLPEYTDLRENTTAGQAEWNKSVSAMTALFSSGDPNNLREASKMFGDLFPGVSFSVDQMIQDIGADRFAKNLTDLATLASTFDTWEEAKASAEGLGIINGIGMGVGTSYDVIDSNGNVVKTVDNPDEAYDATRVKGYSVRVNTSQAQELFEGLKINALDEEWKTISSSDFYKSLPVDSQNLIRDTLTAGLTGELEFDITPAFEVVDKNGNFVKEFDNIIDVNKFIGDNASKGYTYNQTKHYVYKNILTGDQVTINNQGNVVEGGGSKTDPIKGLDELDVTNYYQLTDRTGTNTLFETFKNDPKALRESEYYYKVPSVDYLLENAEFKINPNTGVRSTKINDKFRSDLDNNIGKFVEVPFKNEIISGQLVDYIETPVTVQLKIKLEDGTFEYVPIIDNNKGELYGNPYSKNDEGYSRTGLDWVDTGFTNRSVA